MEAEIVEAAGIAGEGVEIVEEEAAAIVVVEALAVEEEMAVGGTVEEIDVQIVVATGRHDYPS